MSDYDIKLMSRRPVRGKYPVSLLLGENVVLTGEVNPHRPEDVELFLQRATAELPGLNGELETLRGQLLQLAAPPKPSDKPLAERVDTEIPYRELPSGIVWLKPVGEAEVPISLTNFAARIVSDVVRDDGAEREHVLEIEVGRAGKQVRVQVPAAQFPGMGWVIDRLGPKALVYPGNTIRDHARAAIQMLSPDTPARVIYAHTGFREIDGQHVYLHAGGAIGAQGPVAGIEVALPDALSAYKLPDPPEGDERRDAVRETLGILDLAPDHVAVPGIAATYRAVLEKADFSLGFFGPTGAFKSEFASVLVSSFGKEINARQLLSWSSTENALELVAHAAKDAPLIIDDFAPTGSQYDVSAFHRRADRILRAQGNRSGRARMRSDGTLRPVKPPRSLIIVTGEDVPRGQSIRSRMLIVEIAPDDIGAEQLTRCQRAAAAGQYARSMSGFIKWWICRVWRDGQDLRQKFAAYRDAAVKSSQHRRTPEIVANLALGWRAFLDFAVDAEAIGAADEAMLWQRGWEALAVVAEKQSAHQQASEPTKRFLELLCSGIGSGTAHLAGRDGTAPAESAAWGWRKQSMGTGAYARDEWHPQGDRVGWIEDDVVYLDPDASYRAAQAMAGGGEGLVVGPQTLRKRLFEKGLLLREGKRDELTVRRVLDGQSRRVLQISVESLLSGKPAISAKPASASGFDPENDDPMAGSMAGSGSTDEETRHPTRHQNRNGTLEIAGDGGNGGNGGLPTDGRAVAPLTDAEVDRLEREGIESDGQEVPPHA
jgi:hypothetical protein